VYDICFAVGFNNINYFNRLFKQQTGLSPLQYRKKVLRIK
ncbi:MAG: AraC family transcriptional regulator, partial [Clostridiaceae bacterium]|nr:AraC family transcriptional regulator [Clostridiaceae bacterium]